MNVKEIIENYLKENAYGGLYNPDDCCGCYVGELFLCESDPSSCLPGYFVNTVFDDGHFGRCISEKKPEEKNGDILSD